MPRGFFNLLSHIVVAVEVEDIRHQVEGILVVLNVSVEAREVEAIGEVVFIDFAKVFVPP